MTHGSETRVRTAHITIRLSPGERAALEAAADRAGLTPGSYARQIIMGAPVPRQVRRPPVERKELARLLGSLGHIGSNVNQIARVLNSGGEVDDPMLADTLRDLMTMRDAVLSALGRSP